MAAMRARRDMMACADAIGRDFVPSGQLTRRDAASGQDAQERYILHYRHAAEILFLLDIAISRRFQTPAALPRPFT